jgi:hypothetical protein
VNWPALPNLGLRPLWAAASLFGRLLDRSGLGSQQIRTCHEMDQNRVIGRVVRAETPQGAPRKSGSQWVGSGEPRQEPPAQIRVDFRAIDHRADRVGIRRRCALEPDEQRLRIVEPVP